MKNQNTVCTVSSEVIIIQSLNNKSHFGVISNGILVGHFMSLKQAKNLSNIALKEMGKSKVNFSSKFLFIV